MGFGRRHVRARGTDRSSALGTARYAHRGEPRPILTGIATRSDAQGGVGAFLEAVTAMVGSFLRRLG